MPVHGAAIPISRDASQLRHDGPQADADAANLTGADKLAQLRAAAADERGTVGVAHGQRSLLGCLDSDRHGYNLRQPTMTAAAATVVRQGLQACSIGSIWQL